MHRPAIFSFVLVAVTTGCQLFGAVRLTEVATASGKPSNVAVMLTVTQKGEPVTNLGANAFQLRENDQALDIKSADMRLLDPTRVAAYHTVLLLDLGHATSDERKRQLSSAAGIFLHRVRQRQAVTVLGFDGSSKTKLIGDYPIDANGGGLDTPDHQKLVAADPSRNLRGATLEALDTLDARLDKNGRPLHIGTLVVFSRGPDVAGRVPIAEFDARLSAAHHSLVFVDVAGDPSDDEIARLSSAGKIEAQDADKLSDAFEQAGSLVTGRANSYYLVSYCSPGRSGERRLRVEVQVVSDDLQTESSSFEAHFDSSGFTRGCNSANAPRFTGVKRAAGE